MNYFQNLYLCDFQQPPLSSIDEYESCELLSKFVSLWFPTTTQSKWRRALSLWITFKICIFVTPNNDKWVFQLFYVVVNYFQNLYLCDLQQQWTISLMCCTCCELLSKFVSLWLQTTTKHYSSRLRSLWITFKICIFVTSNNTERQKALIALVVNYFQNLYLCDCKQHKK